MHTEIPLLSPRHSKSSSTLPLLFGFLALVAILGSQRLHRHNQELAVRISTLEEQIGSIPTVGNEFVAQPVPPPRNDMKEDVAAAPPANFNAARTVYTYVDMGTPPEEFESALGEIAVGPTGIVGAAASGAFAKIQETIFWLYKLLNMMFGALGFNIEQMRLPWPWATSWEFEIRYGGGEFSRTIDGRDVAYPCNDCDGHVCLCLLQHLQTRLQWKKEDIDAEIQKSTKFKKIQKFFLKGLLKTAKLFVSAVINIVKPLGCVLGYLLQGWYINFNIKDYGVGIQAMFHQYPPMINDIKTGKIPKFPDGEECKDDKIVTDMFEQSSKDGSELQSLDDFIMGDAAIQPKPEPETEQSTLQMIEKLLDEVNYAVDDAPDTPATRIRGESIIDVGGAFIFPSEDDDFHKVDLSPKSGVEAAKVTKFKLGAKH